METDFIYWKHIAPCGVRVEEVSGADDKKGRLWLAMAYQIYCEHGDSGSYRGIGHYVDGAPFLDGAQYRISITHTDHLLAVASLPKTPEADLSKFNPRTALGIDAEREDRRKVLDIREKFLTEKELAMLPADDVRANIVAWTCKEALYKAGMTGGRDWKDDYEILELPNPEEPTRFGKGLLHLGDLGDFPMDLCSYLSEGCVVTIAVSPKAAKYKS